MTTEAFCPCRCDSKLPKGEDEIDKFVWKRSSSSLLGSSRQEESQCREVGLLSLHGDVGSRQHFVVRKIGVEKSWPVNITIFDVQILWIILYEEEAELDDDNIQCSYSYVT